MKRIALLICFAVCLFSLLVSTVFAHPGKTDSKGGHTNHSTGEYHYHHGYSAHDHYDMDGDGKKDCPYEFKNKERSYADEASRMTPKATTAATSPTRATEAQQKVEQKTAKESSKSKESEFDRTFCIIVLYGFACALVSCVAVFIGDSSGSGKIMILSVVMWIIFAIVRRIFL